MSIHYLIAIATLAALLLVAGPALRALRWLAEVREAKHRRRHALRRRARAKGYLPVYDDRWHPDISVAGQSPEGDAAWEALKRSARLK